MTIEQMIAKAKKPYVWGVWFVGSDGKADQVWGESSRIDLAQKEVSRWKKRLGEKVKETAITEKRG